MSLSQVNPHLEAEGGETSMSDLRTAEEVFAPYVLLRTNDSLGGGASDYRVVPFVLSRTGTPRMRLFTGPVAAAATADEPADPKAGR